MSESSYSSDSSDSESSASAGDNAVVVAPSAPQNASHRRIVRRPARRVDPVAGTTSNGTPTGVTSSTPVAPISPAGEATQNVGTKEEADALVRRLKQLEGENASLANTLAKICDENARLTGRMAGLEDRIVELTQDPLKGTSVLQSLFEPEKTGWFGGSKSAAREQLEKLSQAMQSEYIEYKASHASTNDEVKILLEAMQTANTNAADVSKIVNDQQQLMSSGPLAVTVRIVPFSESDLGADGPIMRHLREELDAAHEELEGLKSELAEANADLQLKCTEVIKLQNDLKEYKERPKRRDGAASSANSPAPAVSPMSPSDVLKKEIEMRKAKEENTKLREELQQLRQALQTEEQLHNIKKAESAELTLKLDAQTSAHRDAMNELRRQYANSASSSLRDCPRCDDMRAELEAAKQEAEKARTQLQAAKTESAKSAATSSTSIAAVQAQVLELQAQLEERELAVKRSVPQEQHAQLQRERDSLSHELELANNRVETLEERSSAAAAGGVVAAGIASKNSSIAMNDSVVLRTLENNKDSISRLEFERDQLRQQLQQAQSYAVTRDQDAQRVERSATEDKQRVAFLLKKCAGITADLRTTTAARDALSEEVDRHKVEAKQLQRQVESNASLAKRSDDLMKEKTQMEARLSSATELEEKLVKAKETIAYMELAQSRTINMSQYAELQAAKDKLENTMGPMKKQLEDANKEIERLKSVTDAQQLVTGSQLNSVQNMQDQLAASNANESKLREKVANLSSENDRLQKVNSALEAQMSDMQDGIKEMAVQMEKERTTATTKAEANSQKQVEDLKAQLEKAKTELGTVQATRGQFVAEGLYQNACTERDRLMEESAKKATEIEKMKSEIRLYCATIADLEAENDGHVRAIEDAEERQLSERTSLSERLSAEQKKVAELSATVDSLRESAKTTSTDAGQASAKIKELEEKISKQKRAFEDKCTSEDKLNAQVAALQSTNESLRTSYEEKLAEATAAASMAAAPALASAPVLASTSAPAAAAAATPGSTDATAKRLYQLQCDNDRLTGELRRIHIKHKSEYDDDQRTIQGLQMQVKSRMPADLRSAYEAEIAKSKALKASNDTLLADNESLKKQVPTASPLAAMAAPTTALPANASDLQAQLLQAQQQLIVQKSGFDAAMTRAIADAENKQRRIEVLEAQLPGAGDAAPDSAALTNNNSIAFSVEHAGAGGEEDGAAAGAAADGSGAPVSPTRKKKVKKIKKKRTLAEQVAAVDPTADILAAASPVGASDASATHASPTGEVADGAMASPKFASPLANVAAQSAALKEAQLKQRLFEADLLKAQQELETMKLENTKLHDELKQSAEDLQNAQDDLDEAQKSMDVERDELQKRIHELEAAATSSFAQQQDAKPIPGVTRTPLNPGIQRTMSGSGSPPNRSFSRQNTTQEAEMSLRCAQDENEKLRTENAKLRHDLNKASAATSTSAGSPTGTGAAATATTAVEVKKLKKLIKQKDAEIENLRQQLMPIKNKLVEYMAMADRLGLQYPFSEHLDGPTVMRLRSINAQAAQRASSLPVSGAAGSSPVPKPPPGARSGANGAVSPRNGSAGPKGRASAVAADTQEDFSLR